MFASSIQSEKDLSPIVLTLSGKLICFKLEQYLNALLAISTTLLGNEILVNLSQP